uniref:MyTH4 domain-containing protein n=1 Tax=Ditylenchus dipsaci TaxID=166011 RepID=A0A915CX56_9BILA
MALSSTTRTLSSNKSLSTSTQLPCPQTIVVDGLMSIEEFAAQNFKYHILGAFHAPISTPFLPKSTEQEFGDSLKIFKLILCYTNDISLSAKKLTVLAKYILQLGIDNLDQRDEIYIQLCNQTYKNRDESNEKELGTCC